MVHMHRNRPFPRNVFWSICAESGTASAHVVPAVRDSDLPAKVILVGVAAVLGVCQWFDLLALLSVFFHRNEFARRMPQTTPQTLTANVPGELFLCSCLAPFWEVGLQRPWTPTIVATDAADAMYFRLWHTCSNCQHRSRSQIGTLC